MASKRTERPWPGLSSALAGFLPLRPDMRHLVPPAEGLVYRPSSYKYSFLRKRFVLASLLVFLSLTFSYIMWITSIYDNAVLKLVSIRDDIDMVFESWRSPPTKPRLSVYVFNYTNYDAILEGKEFPRVEELGPYVFSEKMERINVQFNPNGTVSFQEKRSIEMLPQESKRSFSEIIRVPNIPLISLFNIVAQSDFALQTLISGLVISTNAQPFLNVTVHDFIWGFEDELFRLLKTLNFFGNEVQPFGFLAKRRGIHHDIVTMYTGIPNLESTGLITRWNGADRIGHWGDTLCDKLESSDGTLFPAHKAQKKQPLYVYSHNMCRRIPIFFNKTTYSKDGFPVQQYNVDDQLFNYNNNFDNKCFLRNDSYLKNGIFYTGPCQKDAPIYASFPHFWLGDPYLTKTVLGLNPNRDKHQSLFQIHERLGVCLLAKMRFQLNIMLQKPKYLPQLNKLKVQKFILPIAWLEYDSGELPEHFVNTIYHLTYTVRVVQEVFKWLSLLLTTGSLYFLYLEAKR